MRRYISLPILVIFFCFAGSASEILLERNGAIRTGPTSKAKRIGSAKKGETYVLESEEVKNRWYQVKWEKTSAWIFSGHVAKPKKPPSTIKIGSFNVLHLGWGKTKDIDMLARIIINFDLCAIIEIMRKPQKEELLAALAQASKEATGENVTWEFFFSDLVGKTTYKERYGFVYRSDRVKALDDGQFIDDEDDVYDRDPYYANFKAGTFDFTLIAVHITFGKKKSDRKGEIEGLRDVFDQVQADNGDEQDVLLMGDFNLAPNDKYWEPLKTTRTISGTENSTNITHLISKDVKTSLGRTGYASSYDNIWIDQTFTKNEYVDRSGAVAFVHDFFPEDEDRFQLAKKLVSDHIPVWGEFKINGVDDDGKDGN